MGKTIRFGLGLALAFALVVPAMAQDSKAGNSGCAVQAEIVGDQLTVFGFTFENNSAKKVDVFVVVGGLEKIVPQKDIFPLASKGLDVVAGPFTFDAKKGLNVVDLTVDIAGYDVDSVSVLVRELDEKKGRDTVNNGLKWLIGAPDIAGSFSGGEDDDAFPTDPEKVEYCRYRAYVKFWNDIRYDRPESDAILSRNGGLEHYYALCAKYGFDVPAYYYFGDFEGAPNTAEYYADKFEIGFKELGYSDMDLAVVVLTFWDGFGKGIFE